MTNANDQLAGYIGSENHYRYNRVMISDGAKAFADKFGAYWFLDVISSYQGGHYSVSSLDMQVWQIKRNKTGNGAVVTCEDGNKNVVITQRIKFTDFEPNEGTLWLVNRVCYLPSEH